MNLGLIQTIKVPLLSGSFQSLINNIVLQGVSAHKKGDECYSQAEQILLSKLNLLNWKPKHRHSFVKNFSDAQSSERIDAEYFQPMYDEIVKAITSLKNYDCLGNLVNIKKCVEPGSEAYQESGIAFLRVSNLSKFGINDNNQKYISEELYGKLKQHQPKQEEILLSKDATPGIAYYLKDKPGKIIPSGGILRLTVKDRKKFIQSIYRLFSIRFSFKSRWNEMLEGQ